MVAQPVDNHQSIINVSTLKDSDDNLLSQEQAVEALTVRDKEAPPSGATVSPPLILIYQTARFWCCCHRRCCQGHSHPLRRLCTDKIWLKATGAAALAVIDHSDADTNADTMQNQKTKRFWLEYSVLLNVLLMCTAMCIGRMHNSSV